MDILTIILTVLMVLLCTLFLLVKRKTIEIIVVHLIVMLFTLYIGAAMVFPESSVIGVFIALYGVVSFIANVLMVEA